MPESRAISALGRRIPTGLGGGVFWLAVWFGLLVALRHTSFPAHRLLGWMEVLVGATLLGLTLILAVRIIRRHFLWSLRNKLILTYVLIGLAPVMMLLILSGILAYFATGQFSVHLADSRMHQELDDLSAQNVGYVRGTAGMMRLMASGFGGPQGPRPPFARPRVAANGQRPTVPRPSFPQTAATQNATQQTPLTAAQGLADATPTAEALPDSLRARLRPDSRMYLNGVPCSLAQGCRPNRSTGTSASLGLPPWATDLHGNQFHDLVLDGGELYLVAIDQRNVEGKGILTSVTSLPVDGAMMDVLAKGLGRVDLTGLEAGNKGAAQQNPPSDTDANRRKSASLRIGREIFTGTVVFGGVQPLPVNFGDFRMYFPSTLDTTDWSTGTPAATPAYITVRSRPSLLYRQLFGSTLGGIFNKDMRDGLIALCAVFALIEILALWMAFRLFRALTSSVHELYEATRRIDRGDLVHLIPTEHAAKQDQLGELSRSFNRMTGSLERLLIEQQEKERMQSELTIAQEVQANLFPHLIQNLPTLELHGICRPARTVSGDYYDFFVFRGAQDSRGAPGPETGVGIALGDISGKGISAALLMATLHSAVRAYRLVSEDLAIGAGAFVAAGASIGRPFSAQETSVAAPTAVLTENGSAHDVGGAVLASPARILSLVNRHLYTSTQPEKYATLFLAHYDAATSRLTYSNAGHLPPIILGRDGSVRRLDHGGTVVGLFAGVEYEEASLPLRSGDIFIGYSDGITEPENDFGEFGEERLIETVARYRNEPLSVISAQVMLALDAWIGAAEQPDDITLVLARQV